MCSFHCYEDLPTCGEGGSALSTVGLTFEQKPVSVLMWTSTGFLMEIIIRDEILLGLKCATAGSTDCKCIERSNAQAHLPL